LKIKKTIKNATSGAKAELIPKFSIKKIAAYWQEKTVRTKASAKQKKSVTIGNNPRFNPQPLINRWKFNRWKLRIRT